jgi:diacylglycerol kinase family enzyme
VTSYLLVVNPVSGRGRASSRAKALRSSLAESGPVQVVETRARGFASDAVAERGHAFDRVIAIGGDGTLNEVLSGLMRVGSSADTRPSLGFLPSGTANAAVSAFGFASDPVAVARFLTTAETRPVDVGIATYAGLERPFLLWFGAGYDAVVIDTLNRQRTGFMGVVGLARGTPRVLGAVRSYSAPDIEIRADGRVIPSAASVILANVGRMAFGITVGRAVDPFDGRLDLVSVPRVGTWGLAALGLRMMISSLDGAGSVGHELAQRVRLESRGDVPFQLDGEPVGMLPVEVRVEPGAVRLLLT